MGVYEGDLTPKVRKLVEAAVDDAVQRRKATGSALVFNEGGDEIENLRKRLHDAEQALFHGSRPLVQQAPADRVTPAEIATLREPLGLPTTFAPVPELAALHAMNVGRAHGGMLGQGGSPARQGGHLAPRANVGGLAANVTTNSKPLGLPAACFGAWS